MARFGADVTIVEAGDRLLPGTVDLRGLGLESASLDESAQFIQVDKRMRAADGIWAMGDITGKAMFTHVADILGEDHPPAQYDAVPRATFTDPEVGVVGMTAAEAMIAGLDVIVVVKQLPATIRAWLHSSGPGIIKVIVDRKTGVLVGATAVGPHHRENARARQLADQQDQSSLVSRMIRAA